MSYEDAFGDFARHFRHGPPKPKREERRRLLEEHPELRRRINFAPLRNIIDFVMFKCVHGSSIARDEAIQGSDIDGGLVVLRGPESIDRQLALVDALREQGFNVYHPAEAAAAKSAYEAALARGIQLDSLAYDALSQNKTERSLNSITFMTEEELRAADRSMGPGRIYFYGYTIPEQPM